MFNDLGRGIYGSAGLVPEAPLGPFLVFLPSVLAPTSSTLFTRSASELLGIFRGTIPSTAWLT